MTAAAQAERPAAYDFFVAGLPAPGGSKRAFVVKGRAVVTEDCKRSKPWRASVASAAQDACPAGPLAGPLRLDLVFTVPRPKGHYGSGKNAGSVKPSAPPFPTTKPDTTKLVRSTEDALKNIAWLDDSQIVEQTARKVYGDKPGVRVVVKRIEG